MKRNDAGLQEFFVMLYENGSYYGRSGFLSYYNKTTNEIIPSCDRLFTIRNAQVINFYFFIFIKCLFLA